MAESWLQFWNREHAIYASERHKQVHFRRIAEDILALLPHRPGLRMLDYGCGEALEAPRLATRLGQLHLYDAAVATREKLKPRFAGLANISVPDDAEFAAMPDNSVDVITLISVAQYLKPAELADLLRAFHRLIAPDGVVILADIVHPDIGILDDVVALLASAIRHGFLLAALRSLAVTLFSDYSRLRKDIGLSTYAEADLLAMLNAAGFSAERAPRNIGFHQGRRTYLARPI